MATTTLTRVCICCGQTLKDVWLPVFRTRQPALCKETTYDGPRRIQQRLLIPPGSVGRLGTPYPEGWLDETYQALQRAAHSLGFRLEPITELDLDDGETFEDD